jgi:predicted DNA-binding transcriptional regulator AlpA
MSRSAVIPPEARLGLSRAEAAEYIGVSTTLFDQMVEDGRMPRPKEIGARRVWSRPALELAFANLPEPGGSANLPGEPKVVWAQTRA